MSSASQQPLGIIYCRVSSKEQVDGTSLESQERYCREWAERHHITVVRVFVDKGESAKTTDRTEFLKAIAFCSQKRNSVNYFIVYRLDRFARSQDDHVSVRATLRRYGVELRSATEPINDTPVGRAMEGMISVFAEFDNNVRRERCVGGMMERLRQGIWVWKAPLGYYRPTRGSNLAPDPTLAPYIRLAFSEYAKGIHTYESLADFLAERGMRTANGKRPCAQLMQKILSNPLYCGIIQAWGERYEARFEPLVPRTLFERCQPGYRAPSPERPSRHSRYHPAFPLRRVICTLCGHRLTGSFSRSARGRYYPYYHHHKQSCALAVFLPKNAFESRFTIYLDAISLSPRFERLFSAVVQDMWKEKVSSVERERLRVERELESLASERQQVFDLHRAGRYTDEEFLEQKALLTTRATELRRLLADAPVTDFPIDEALRTLFPLARRPAVTWARLKPPDRVRFQNLLFENGEIRFDGQGFWNSPLTSFYRLNHEYLVQKSTLVHQAGQDWNRIVADLRAWLEFARSLMTDTESIAA